VYLKQTHGVQNGRLDDRAATFFGGISCLLGGAASDFLVKRTGRKWRVRVGNAGNYLPPSIGAFIAGCLGYSPMFVLYAAAYLSAAAMWLFIDPDKPFYDTPVAPSGRG
jgi:hypothetical protein